MKKEKSAREQVKQVHRLQKSNETHHRHLKVIFFRVDECEMKIRNFTKSTRAQFITCMDCSTKLKHSGIEDEDDFDYTVENYPKCHSNYCNPTTIACTTKLKF